MLTVYAGQQGTRGHGLRPPRDRSPLAALGWGLAKETLDLGAREKQQNPDEFVWTQAKRELWP
jgi:hypothetical protein